MKKIFLIFIIILFSTTALAAASDIYQFKTPAQQERFNYLTQQFRCLVCQNETVADSNAPLAQDLRGQIASLVQQNISDKDITHYLTQRYGDFVLFNTPLKNTTYLLWLTPFILLIGGLLLWIIFVRTRR